MHPDVTALIDRLDLTPHPEGGWYRETWRPRAADGGRGPATAILFLLDAGGRSARHRVDADELWLWHAGAPLLLTIDGSDPVRLGGDVLRGERPQAIVPAHAWQAAHAERGWALVSCVVAPAFDFAGFELAEPAPPPGA